MQLRHANKPGLSSAKPTAVEELIKRALDHCRELGVNDRGLNYIRETAQAPSRNCQSRMGNVTARFASRKMGLTIACESHTIELVFVYLQEYRKETLWYFDQPVGIKVRYEKPDGRAVTILHIPDFLVIESDGISLVECKPRQVIPDPVEKNPGRYRRDEAGNLRCPAAEKIAADLGFQYRIWSPNEGDELLVKNLADLADYHCESTPDVPKDTVLSVEGVVQSNPGISIGDLRCKIESLNIDHLYILVARNLIYCDLRRFRILDHKATPLYINEATAKAHEVVRQQLGPRNGSVTQVSVHLGAELIWNDRPMQIAQLNADAVGLTDGKDLVRLNRGLFEQLVGRGEIVGFIEPSDQAMSESLKEVFVSATERDHEIATRRWELLRDPESAAAREIPRRTFRRWRRDYRAAEQAGGAGYFGLLPRFHARGNHNPRLLQVVYELVDRIIDENYLNLKQRNKRAVFGLIKVDCDQRSLPCPSYQWVVDRVNSRDKYVVVLARKGHRAAYRYSPQLHGKQNPNHPDRPMQLVLVDHTQLDQFLRSDDTGEDLGKAWLTLAMDAFSRRIIAFVISFDAPSYRILMVLVRLIVQRYRRMPSHISIDGGKEFSSVFFQSLMARCECNVIKRPPARPRFGSLIERAFGVVNTSFLSNLAGNSQIMKNVRQVTKNVRPEGQAVWSLESLHDLLSTFFFELYDQRPHLELGTSPAQKYALGMKIAGSREHRVIVPNEEFLMMTMPTTSKGSAKVVTQRGVLVHGVFFWGNGMELPQIEGSQVPIRFDPFDFGHCYAFLSKKWVECFSAYNGAFRGKTEKEIMIASELIRQEARRFGKTTSVSAAKLAQFFMTEVEPVEAVRKQRLKDLAFARIYTRTKQATGLLPVAEDGLDNAGAEGRAQLGEAPSASSDFWPTAANEVLPQL